MEMARFAHEADFVFEVQGYTGELRLLSFSGNEAVSELFGFSIHLASQDAAIDIDAIVGQPAVLTIFHEGGERYIQGIVSRFEQGSTGEDFTPYHAQLVPDVWLLTQRYGCRIHQQLSVPDIVKKVLTDAGVPEDRFRFSLSGSYTPREYCVQYRESDWNFISRLLEEEGIFYLFEHTADACTLVMGDSLSVYSPIDSPDTILFREISGTVAEEDAVFEYRHSQRIRPGSIKYRAYNFEKPDLDLEKDDSAERDAALAVYDYPGTYADPDAGKHVATIALEAAQAQRILGSGQSTSRRLMAGYLFTLDEHPREDFNREYLLLNLNHTGIQPLGTGAIEGGFKYHNEFHCIPSDVVFRPERRTPKPVIHGTQTAAVTGPKGEEIHPDKYGRVKAQFHWDREGKRDERSSCWIRVSQLWAGKGWGAMQIPRIGQEVIVAFLEGDPDQPIIIGRVYHGTNSPPYPLPAEKTKSTIKSDCSKGSGGSNEIRFEDLKGSEEVYVHAQKDMNEVIENHMSTSVGANQSLTVGKNRTKTVKGEETTTVTGNRTETVKKGDEKVTIETGHRTIAVNTGDDKLVVKTGNRIVEVNTGNDQLTVKTGNHTIDVNTGDDKLSVKSGAKTDKVMGPYEITVNKDCFKVKCGLSQLILNLSGLIEIKGSDINIKATGDIKINGMNIESKANASNNTKGALVMSEASAVNTVKGGMVMLNP